jgi:uncharacterized protein YeaO (DUF488 family)
MIHEAHVARVYEHRTATDGLRVLVDRIWPRGLSKSTADLDDWCKEIAPSTELRRWYGHEPSRWSKFQQLYWAELADPPHALAVERLRQMTTHQDVTLLTATRDISKSHAAVVLRFLTDKAL